MSEPVGASATLAHAFFDDPGFAWAMPRARHRWAQLEAMFRVGVAHARRVGGVAADGQGVALWTPRAYQEVSALAALRWQPLLPLRMGPRAMFRVEAMERDGTALVERHVDHAYAYLMAIGVHPKAQGHGWGRRVHTLALQQMRESGHAHVVLRTEKAANLGFYRHLGYEVLGEQIMPSCGLRSWALRLTLSDHIPRRPQKAARAAGDGA